MPENKNGPSAGEHATDHGRPARKWLAKRLLRLRSAVKAGQAGQAGQAEGWNPEPTDQEGIAGFPACAAAARTPIPVNRAKARSGLTKPTTARQGLVPLRSSTPQIVALRGPSRDNRSCRIGRAPSQERSSRRTAGCSRYRQAPGPAEGDLQQDDPYIVTLSDGQFRESALRAAVLALRRSQGYLRPECADRSFCLADGRVAGGCGSFRPAVGHCPAAGPHRSFAGQRRTVGTRIRQFRIGGSREACR